MSKKVFISYRRDDAKADARDLHNRLRKFFGRSNVFMDVDNLLAGQRFDHQLDSALKQCDTLLAIIGPRWLEILNERSQNQERDYVCEEIAAALDRKIAVIPVVVDGAVLPSQNDLPASIQELTYYQKHDITHERFGRDVETLVADIKAVRKFNNGSATPGNVTVGLATAFAVLGFIAISWFAIGSGNLDVFMGANSTVPSDVHDQLETGRTEAIRRTEQLRRKAEEQQKAEREAQERRKAEEARQAKLEADIKARNQALKKAKAHLLPGRRDSKANEASPYEQWRRQNRLTEDEAQRRLKAARHERPAVQNSSPSYPSGTTSTSDALRRALDRPAPPVSSSASTYVGARAPVALPKKADKETPYEQWLRLNSKSPMEKYVSPPTYNGHTYSKKQALERALDRPTPPKDSIYSSTTQSGASNYRARKETPYEEWRRLNSAAPYDRSHFSPIDQGSTYGINQALRRALDRPKPPTR